MIAGLYKIFEHWHREGTLFIFSDPHFNDTDLNACIKRPDAEELVKLINSKVGRKDTIIILGDIVDIEPVKKIRGYKVLIMGNHDSGRTNYERQVITRTFPQEVFQKDEALLEMQRIYPGCRYIISEEYDFEDENYVWVIKADNQLFDEVYEGPLMIFSILSFIKISLFFLMSLLMCLGLSTFTVIRIQGQFDKINIILTSVQM